MEEKIAKAYLRQVRISPRKIKFILDLIRNKDLATALAILKNTNKMACECLIKLVESAAANAENNFGMDPEKLYVAECFANKGPTMKRIHPRAQGRAYRIEKRVSHITIVLDKKGAE